MTFARRNFSELVSAPCTTIVLRPPVDNLQLSLEILHFADISKSCELINWLNHQTALGYKATLPLVLSACFCLGIWEIFVSGPGTFSVRPSLCADLCKQRGKSVLKGENVRHVLGPSTVLFQEKMPFLSVEMARKHLSAPNALLFYVTIWYWKFGIVSFHNSPNFQSLHNLVKTCQCFLPPPTPAHPSCGGSGGGGGDPPVSWVKNPKIRLPP